MSTACWFPLLLLAAFGADQVYGRSYVERNQTLESPYEASKLDGILQPRRMPSRRKVYAPPRNIPFSSSKWLSKHSNAPKKYKDGYGDLSQQLEHEPQATDFGKRPSKANPHSQKEYGHIIDVVPGHAHVQLKVVPEEGGQSLYVEPVVVGHKIRILPETRSTSKPDSWTRSSSYDGNGHSKFEATPHPDKLLPLESESKIYKQHSEDTNEFPSYSSQFSELPDGSLHETVNKVQNEIYPETDKYTRYYGWDSVVKKTTAKKRTTHRKDEMYTKQKYEGTSAERKTSKKSSTMNYAKEEYRTTKPKTSTDRIKIDKSKKTSTVPSSIQTSSYPEMHRTNYSSVRQTPSMASSKGIPQPSTKLYPNATANATASYAVSGKRPTSYRTTVRPSPKTKHEKQKSKDGSTLLTTGSSTAYESSEPEIRPGTRNVTRKPYKSTENYGKQTEGQRGKYSTKNTYKPDRTTVYSKADQNSVPQSTAQQSTKYADQAETKRKSTSRPTAKWSSTVRSSIKSTQVTVADERVSSTTARHIDFDREEDFLADPVTEQLNPLFEGSGDLGSLHAQTSENTTDISSRFLDFFADSNDTCTTPKNEPGHCKSFRQCVLHDVVNNFNMYMQYMCRTRSTLIGVCCPDNPVIEVTNPDAIDVTTPTARDIPVQPADGCGMNSRTRIVGGTIAKPHEWTWMVALLRKNRFFCGGVLINNWYVLTAAHCVMSMNIRDIIARFGEYNLNEKMKHQQDIPLAEVKRHAQFTTLTFQNDIALLKLRRPVEFSRFVGTICLPMKGNNYTNANATVVGWGTVSFGGSASPILRQVTIPVWDNEDCDRTYALETINESFMCAGSPNKEQDACQGDSGGPLMVLNDQGRWEVIGLVSWGRRCGDPNFPGVYTRVTTYLAWIHENSQ